MSSITTFDFWKLPIKSITSTYCRRIRRYFTLIKKKEKTKEGKEKKKKKKLLYFNIFPALSIADVSHELYKVHTSRKNLIFRCPDNGVLIILTRSPLREIEKKLYRRQTDSQDSPFWRGFKNIFDQPSAAGHWIYSSVSGEKRVVKCEVRSKGTQSTKLISRMYIASVARAPGRASCNISRKSWTEISSARNANNILWLGDVTRMREPLYAKIRPRGLTSVYHRKLIVYFANL